MNTNPTEDSTPLVVRTDVLAAREAAAASYVTTRTAALGYTPEQTAEVLAALGLT